MPLCVGGLMKPYALPSRKMIFPHDGPPFSFCRKLDRVAKTNIKAML
jgi:hypothetical protein